MMLVGSWQLLGHKPAIRH